MKTREWTLPMVLVVCLAVITIGHRVEAFRQANQEELMKMSAEVVSVIADLPDYTVYDWITFGMKDNVVYLRGYVRNTTLKTSAAYEVERIKGVKEVKNEIEFVRTSSGDEVLRREIYRAIYDTYLGKYAEEAYHYSPGAPRSSEPLGPHPIHILVREGEVILMGYVFLEEDKQKATQAVESVAGSDKVVKNELTIAKK